MDMILGEISRFFHSQTGEQLDTAKLIFVDDESVEYHGINLRIPKSELVRFDDAEPFLQRYVQGGPDWVHFQQCVQADNKVLITVRRGALINAKQPSINTSLTRNYQVEFV